MAELGDRLRMLRKQAGMTQRELGDAVGVSFTHISKIESETEQPSLDLLKRLAVELDADIDELVLLADRLPEDVARAVSEKSDLAVQFLRSWQRGEIQDDDVRRMLPRDHDK